MTKVKVLRIEDVHYKWHRKIWESRRKTSFIKYNVFSKGEWRREEFSFEGLQPRGSRDRSPSVGSRGEAVVGVWDRS